MAEVTITADLELEKIELTHGAQLVIAGSAKTLIVDSITDDNTGHIYLMPSTKLQIKTLLSPCARIFHGAELILTDLKPNVSLKRSVDIYGTLSLRRSPVVIIGNHQGSVTMHPGSSPSNLTFGELVLKPSSRLRLLNYEKLFPKSCRWTVTMTGSKLTLENSSNFDVSCPLNLTGDQMIIGRDASFRIHANSLVSYVSMNNVQITGTFEPGVMSMLDGWASLRIESYGHMQFFPFDDVRLDTLYANGSFCTEGAVYIRGSNSAVTRTIEIDEYGRANFDLSLSANSLGFVRNNSQEYGAHGKHSLNGASLVHADIVVVNGQWLPRKLKILPGWKELTVETGGIFNFDPVGVYNLDKLYLHGSVKALNAFELAGLSEERSLNCEVGQTGAVLMESLDLTTIRCKSVVILGTLRVGNLFIGSHWDLLAVNGSYGKFYFGTSRALNINQTHVSGLIQTGSAVGPTVPWTGDSVTIATTGTVSIHYQAQPSVFVDGTVNSTFYVTTLQIDGTLRLGSLYVASDNFVVGSTGLVTVDGGGALGGAGPGRGTGHSSGASGASYGGRGGRGAMVLAQDLIYGDIFSPGAWGSGGGNGSGGVGGGRGGGRIFIQSQTLHVNGIIQTNGLSGQVTYTM